MRRSGLVLALFLIVSTLAATARASEENAAVFIQALVAHFPLATEPCKEKYEKTGGSSVFTCARSRSDFASFREAWDALMENADKLPFLPTPVTGWQTGVGGRMRWYSLGDKWIVVTFDSANRQIVLSYAKDKPGVLSLTKSISPPRRAPVDYEDGAARRAARLGLKPEAQGVVVVTAVVHKDGTVGDAEILGCLPRNRGLEQAAMNAIQQWRYTPAVKDGDKVDIAMAVSLTYGPGGTFRVADVLDATDGGRVSESPGSGRQGP